MTVAVKPAGAKRDQVPEEGPSQLVQQKERQEEVYRPQRGQRKTDRRTVCLEDCQHPDRQLQFFYI
jgi:hypothetical protein